MIAYKISSLILFKKVFSMYRYNKTTPINNRICCVKTFLLVFFTPFFLNAQTEATQSAKEKRLYDSLETLYQNAGNNDTLKIFYKFRQQQYYDKYNPQKAVTNAFKYFSIAKRSNHPMSVVRCYEMIFMAYIKQAEAATNENEKENALTEADKYMQERIKYCFDNLKGLEALDHAFWTSRTYRSFYYKSIHRPEFYLHREVNGYLSVLKRTDKNKYSEMYINVLHHLAVTFQNKNRTVEAAKYYIQVAEFCDSIKNYDRASEFYNNLGYTYMADGNFFMAQKYLFKSLQVINIFPKDSIENNKNRLTNISSTYANIGRVFTQQRSYTQALDYIQKSIDVSQKAELHFLAARLSARKADLYFKLGKTDSAKVILKKTLNNAGKLKDEKEKKLVMAVVNNVKANILSEQGKHNEAIALAETNLKQAREAEDNNTINTCIESLAKIYYNAGLYKQSVDISREQFKLIEKLNYWEEIFKAKCYLGIGKAFIKTNQLDSALVNLNKAKHQAERVNAKYEMSNVYQTLSEVYKKKGNLPEAINYLDKFVQYKDSFLGEQVSQQVSAISSQFESSIKMVEEKAKKEKEELENLQREERHRNQRMILSTVIIAVSLLVVIMGFAFARKRRDNRILQSQKKEIEDQKIIVEVKNKEILDSINYAKRIQKALYSSKNSLNSHLKENFVLFKPKDIVSGDFYWTTQAGDYFYLAVCDSTGHGVPGAFMSLLNSSYLSEAINEKRILQPNEVFDYVRSRLIESISSDGNKDGMDGVLVRFDKKNKEITYAAAQNPIVLVRDNELVELKADKMPVGVGEVMKEFSLNTVKYKEGDMLYIFTDGYADQFGGPKGKKFKYSTLYKMFTELYGQSSQVILKTMEETFDNWKGNLEQIDDVCVVGIRM